MAKAVDNTKISLLGDPNMLLPIEILDLSVRALNGLKQSGNIHYIGELVAEHMSFIEKCRNVGKKSLKEIATKLAAKGYKVGEGYEQFGNMLMGTLEDLRILYEIPADVEAPTKWVKIEGRKAVQPVTNNAGKLLTDQFSGTVHLPVPYEVTDELELAALKRLCQKAFDRAVNHEVEVAFKPKKKATLQQALRKHIPFDDAADYPARAYARLHVRASESLTSVLNYGFLNRVAKSLGDDMIKGFVLPVLAPKA